MKSEIDIMIREMEILEMQALRLQDGTEQTFNPALKKLDLYKYRQLSKVKAFLDDTANVDMLKTLAKNLERECNKLLSMYQQAEKDFNKATGTNLLN